MILAEMKPTGARSSFGLSTETPAKINLTLDVRGRRPDGYHELRSLVIGVNLRDCVTVTSTPGDGPSITCNLVELEVQSNLAVRAVRALGEFLGRCAEVRIELLKRIPIGAGLGGGSSDAAAVLRICNQLWDARLDGTALSRIGAKLGSDVPLFFSLPSALLVGRGETVVPAPMLWNGWALLLLPDIQVSTAEVYRAWQPADATRFPSGADAELIKCRTAREMQELLSNQLEPAAFREFPQLRDLHNAAQDCAGGPVRISGSGSSMFMLFDDPQAADFAAARIRAMLPHVRTVVAQVPAGEGPVIRVSK